VSARRLPEPDSSFRLLPYLITRARWLDGGIATSRFFRFYRTQPTAATAASASFSAAMGMRCALGEHTDCGGRRPAAAAQAAEEAR
jgi:hypothetical protein